MIDVIIIEDDILIAELNKAYVESVAGFYVKGIFHDGHSALDYLRVNKIDLILLDIYMPKFNGLKLLEEIRHSGILIDAILVTASKDATHIDEVLKLGAVDYLIKPFTQDRIKSSLLNYASRFNLIHDKISFKQEDIDMIKFNNFNSSMNNLKKGLHEKTLERICNYMKNNNDRYYTSEEVAEKIKMSRVTIKKYLDYLVSKGDILSDLDYKSVGRPSYLYKYNREN